MFAKIKTAGLFGVQGFPAEAEADYQKIGLPGFYLTGALSAETKEAQFRVMTALRNSGVQLQAAKITVNIAPASRRKEGTAYDLAILTAVLRAAGVLTAAEFPAVSGEFFETHAFLGEVGLDGSIKPVKGVLPMTDALKAAGLSGVVVPRENAAEACLVPGLSVFSAKSVAGLLKAFREGTLAEASEMPAYGGEAEETEKLDFSDVRGQAYLKRAAEIAVSGRHNILFSGTAGSGKTMIAKRLSTIMPRLSREEEIELTRIYSICGMLPEKHPLITKRPFRAPHHASSVPALLGGGNPVRPGEVSLASKGILFLDELPLFKREVIEALREPLEEKRIIVTRMRGVYEFPADFSLAAAMNNCPCGFYPDLSRCHCTRAQIRLYQGRLSKPIVERIDICAEALPVSFEALEAEGHEETSAEIRARVERVYEIQKARFADAERTRCNGEMTPAEVKRFCRLGKEETAFIRAVFRKKGLSARTYHKVLKVARTIADMDGEKDIRIRHLSEAVALRSFEERMFGGREEGTAFDGNTGEQIKI